MQAGFSRSPESAPGAVFAPVFPRLSRTKFALWASQRLSEALSRFAKQSHPNMRGWLFVYENSSDKITYLRRLYKEFERGARAKFVV
jgi:hypothetical protein